MDPILLQLMADREYVLGALGSIQAIPCRMQQRRLGDVRSRLLGDRGLSLGERCRDYLAYSDEVDAGFCLSDDRVHGEHHKLDVLKWGLLCAKEAHLTGRDMALAVDLLPIVLNDHDEGRRVAGDTGHETKGGILVGLRLKSFLEYDSLVADSIAIVIANHSGITKRKAEAFRPRNEREDIWARFLMIGDRISAIDPLRVLGYFLKYVTRERTPCGRQRDVWENMLRIWRESVTAGAMMAQECGLHDIGLMMAEGLEEAVAVAVRYGGRKGWEFDAIVQGIREGDDVEMLNEQFGMALPSVPVYVESF